MTETYKVIGLMSGTSLDGVDLAFCEFTLDQSWTFKIIKTETCAYSQEWLNRLINIHKGSAIELSITNLKYGKYLGELINSFIDKNSIKADFIASHGHTVFHQPEKSLTLQIGDGNAIAAQTELLVIYDFRSKDVAFGGQGAPLVPIGDRLLFSNYNYCINLGGIANISFERNGKRIAFDICPANQVLNYLANQFNKAFDKNGEIASKGKLNQALLNKLNDLDYYKQDAPKTLGREWVEESILPILNQSKISIEDQLHTFTEHIAAQISIILNQELGNALISGGGAYNQFLVNRIQSLSNSKIEIPSSDIVDFKEAMIFAFLGTLRLRNEINCLSSVTGAFRDSSTGIITA